MITNSVAYSANSDVVEAFRDIKAQIEGDGQGVAPKMIIFSSCFEHFETITKMLKEEYPEATTIGTTSFINCTNKGYSEKAVSAIILFDGIECASGVLLEANVYPMRYVEEIEKAVRNLHSSDNTICFEFSTAFYGCEELVQDTYRSVLNQRGIPIIGGSAGAELTLSTTRVSLNGTVYNNASVFVLIHNKDGKIRLYKENIFKPTNHILVATDVDCDERAVYEYNGKPAAEAVAEALMIPVSELSKSAFMHPVGRISGDNIYITETKEVLPDGGITYFARIYGRTRLALLELDDIPKVWNDTAEKIKSENPNPSFVLMVHCLARSQYFLQNNMFDEFTEKLNEEYGNYFLISGYGEQFNFEHLNQTMLLAVFE